MPCAGKIGLFLPNCLHSKGCLATFCCLNLRISKITLCPTALSETVIASFLPPETLFAFFFVFVFDILKPGL